MNKIYDDGDIIGIEIADGMIKFVSGSMIIKTTLKNSTLGNRMDQFTGT